jgi:hypothetical protein
MIREHAFNSRWWGEPVGIVSDPALFAVAPATLAEAGFAQTDTQISFKLDLRRLPPIPGGDELTVEFADETPFAVGADDLALFEHERYRHLPGITPARLNERYAEWSALLVAEQPKWCARLRAGPRTQGWFLSQRDDSGFHLTLAALHRDATVSGHLLYHAAISAYAAKGQRIGGARFSVTNTAVHNIYAGLGARFLAPVGCWLWVRS